MSKKNFMLLLKLILCGLIWFAFSIGIGVLLINIFNFDFKDIIFVEGILLILIGIFSAIGGNAIGASIQGFGQVNAQYIANANLEIIKENQSKTSDIMKTTISIGFSTVSLIIGGILSIILTFIV